MRKYSLAVVILLVVVCVAALGQEAAPTAPVLEPGTTILPEWLQWVLAGATSIITALLTWAFKIFRGKVGDNEAKQDAVDALEVGVTAAYNDLVKDFKAKAGDGKLTPDEKRQCREYAIQKAKEVATSAGRQILNAWGKDMLQTLVEKIVLKRKTAA